MTAGELEDAIQKIEQKYDTRVSQDLAESLVRLVADKKSRMNFGVALRFSLNELNIRGKQQRSVYAAVAGSYFGKRSGQARRAAGKKPARSATSPKAIHSTVEVVLEPDGQYRFNI